MRKNMKNTMKSGKLFAMAALMAVSSVLPTQAASWKQESGIWKWQKDDGSYEKNGWQWLDGNKDGVAECYYFDSNGHMLANTKTPDGYQVNENGAWVENGSVQTKNTKTTTSVSVSADTTVSVPNGNWLKGLGENSNKWWWMNENGSYPTNQWVWLDGNKDGVAECYYFDANGWAVMAGTTPDGYQVDGDGRWVENNAVKTRKAVHSSTTNSKKSSSGGSSSGGSSSKGSSSSSSSNSSFEDSYNDDSVRYGANDAYTGNYGKMTSSQRQEVEDAIEQFKQEHDISSKDDLQKELEIIKWLAGNCEYKSSKNTWTYSTAYSCIVNGEAQCAGYADAFLQTAKACGLEARYVYNTTHAWNLVKLDGEWYHVDVTWEDSSANSLLKDKYINRTDEQIKQIRSHKTWSSAPKANGSKYNSITVLEYALATGITDPDMKGDKYRLWLMDNPGQVPYNFQAQLYHVGVKMDDNSNYFSDPTNMTTEIVSYIQSRFDQGKGAYITVPKDQKLKWMTAQWLSEHVGGTGYKDARVENDHYDDYQGYLIKYTDGYSKEAASNADNKKGTEAVEETETTEEVTSAVEGAAVVAEIFAAEETIAAETTDVSMEEMVTEESAASLEE